MRMKEALCFNLRTSWQEVSRMYGSYASKHEVTLPIAYVLLTLKKDKPMPSTQIAPALNMEPSSMTRLIKNLEEKCLIVKKVDKNDGRQVNIFLTEEGVKKREIAKKTIKEFNESIKNVISDEELELFIGLLNKINQVAESNHLLTDTDRDDE